MALHSKRQKVGDAGRISNWFGDAAKAAGLDLDCNVRVGNDVAEPIGFLPTRGADVDRAVNFLVLERRYVRFARLAPSSGQKKHQTSINPTETQFVEQLRRDSERSPQEFAHYGLLLSISSTTPCAPSTRTRSPVLSKVELCLICFNMIAPG